MEVGDWVTKNFSPILSTNRHTDDKVKKVGSGATFKIISKNQQDASYVYTIQNKMKDTYKIAAVDLNDNFYKVKSMECETPAESKKCTCDSKDLMLHGCKCDAVPNLLDKRYEEMLQELMGPRMEGK